MLCMSYMYFVLCTHFSHIPPACGLRRVSNKSCVLFCSVHNTASLATLRYRRKRVSRILILHLILEAMFELRFPAILKEQTVFTPAFGPDKHTHEVRFREKTLRKKLIFRVFIYLSK